MDSLHLILHRGFSPAQTSLNTSKPLHNSNLVEQTETHVIVRLFFLLNLLLFLCGFWGSGATLLSDWCSRHGKLGWVLVPETPLIS